MKQPFPTGVSVALWIALAIGVVLSGVNLYWGELNQDEGWYLLGARAVAEGQRPYDDFAFTQGPVFLAVYARAMPWIERDGLRAGRIFTGLLGLLAIGLASWMAARLAPPGWAWTAFVLSWMLVWVNVYHSYFSLVVKTYSLAAVFLAASGLMLTWLRSRPAWFVPLIAGLLMALAAGVRLSSGILLPYVGLYLLWRRGKYPLAWFFWGVGGVIGLVWAYGPVFWTAPSDAWFWLVEYHAARDRGGWFDQALLKAGFVSRFVQAYFVLCSVLVVWVVGATVSGRAFLRTRPPVGMLWGAVGLVTLVHLAAPFPYEDYQVFLMPMVSALVAVGVTTWLSKLIVAARQEAWMGGVSVLCLLLTMAASFSSPLNQQWFIQGRDRIWWPVKEVSDLTRLREAGQWLRQQADGEGVLLTQDAYLAIESGLPVPPGFEMGPFALYPDWDRETALRRNVINRELLKEWIQNPQVQWIAVSGYGLAISSPDVVPVEEEERQHWMALVEEQFELVKTVPHFGQAHTELMIYRRLHNLLDPL